VLIAQWNADTVGDALALAHELRADGLRVEVYPDADKLGKQFKYAASTGVPLVIVEGDDERAAGELQVKDLRTGEQQRIPRAEAAPRLRALLGG
jgi:histidyl-tRNA synthetase